MLKKVVLVVAAIALVAGCGGGGSDKPAKTKAPPRTYTLDEMKAALPAADDVEGGLKVLFSCPEDRERCAEPEPGTASVLISLQASTPELTEKQATVEGNVLYVIVRVDADDAASTTEQAERRNDAKRYDGAFDIPRKDLEQEGQYIPGEKGRGEMSDASNGRFSGFRLDRTGDSEAQGNYFASEVDVRSGTASVTVRSQMGAEGRTRAETEKLVDRVLADFLTRLG